MLEDVIYILLIVIIAFIVNFKHIAFVFAVV